MKLSKLMHGFVKIIHGFLRCYTRLSKLIHGFLLVVTRISQNCFMDFFLMLSTRCPDADFPSPEIDGIE